MTRDGDVEKALTEAIRAATQARRAIYEAGWAMDELVRGELEKGRASSMSSSLWSMRCAVSWMQSEGELRGYGEMLSGMLSSLRRIRKEARFEVREAGG